MIKKREENSRSEDPPRPGWILIPPHTIERVRDYSGEALITVSQEAGPLASDVCSTVARTMQDRDAQGAITSGSHVCLDN